MLVLHCSMCSCARTHFLCILLHQRIWKTNALVDFDQRLFGTRNGQARYLIKKSIHTIYFQLGVPIK